VDQVKAALADKKVSERRICAVLGQHRSTQRHAPITPVDEERLTADIVELATTYGRYGYERITHLLRHAGWAVNRKRVYRIWRCEGLKVPQKQPKRGRLWLNDGSCVRLRAERANHVWAWDFVECRTHDGRKIRMLCVVDEFTHACLAIRVKRKLNNADVIETLADIILSRRALPEFMRSDNGPEFIAKALRKWIGEIGVKTASIEKGSPWENGFGESFNARLRDELLNGEIFYTLQEAQIVIEAWRRHFNAVRPHSSLRGRPPAPESITLPAAYGIRPWLARKEEQSEEGLAENRPAH
jgi:transposase InsO family protein